MPRCFLRLPFALLGMSGALAAEPPVPAKFPLEAGFAWIYRGRVKWTERGDKVREKDLQWRMRVLELRRRRAQVIARIEGWLDDLAWYEPGKQPGVYALVSDSRRGLHLIGPPAAETFWAGLGAAAREPISDEVLGTAEHLLPAALTKDSIWGEAENQARADSQSERRVEEIGTQGLDGLGGWTGARRGTYFRIAYRSNPEHSLVDFVPGLGFTSYTYVHHGSISECEMKLVAVEGQGRVRPGKNRAK